MMGGWPTAKLGDLIEFFDHQRVPLNSRERAVRSGPFPYYGASGVIDSIDEFLFDGRYLLIAEDGENLRSRKTPVAFFADGRFWVNNHAHIVRGVVDKADDRYLKAAFQWLDLTPYITGAAQPKLSQANLRLVELPCPPIEEQWRIADVLSAYDDLIENNQKRIGILEEMAHALYREWFMEFRFPARNGLRGDCAAGTLPDGWRRGVLKDVLRLQRGFDITKAVQRTGPIPVISSSGPSSFHDSSMAKGPGVVIGRKGTLGTVFYCRSEYWPHDTTLWVKEFFGHGPWYIYHLLQELRLAQYDCGASNPTLNRNHIHEVPVVVPPTDVTLQYHVLVDEWMRLVDQLQQANSALRATRDLLLPRLISGELDVSRVPDPAAL